MKPRKVTSNFISTNGLIELLSLLKLILWYPIFEPFLYTLKNMSLSSVLLASRKVTRRMVIANKDFKILGLSGYN